MGEGSAFSLSQTIKPSAAGRVVGNVKTQAINGVAWIYVPNKGLRKVKDPWPDARQPFSVDEGGCCCLLLACSLRSNGFKSNKEDTLAPAGLPALSL